VEKSYDPKRVESRWYPVWLERGYFTPSVADERPAYCIVIPPPNITGSLHMGHALNTTLQDILIRWRRMEGFNTLWLPGTDHAGIATQNVVEKQLASEGVSREALGRDRFVQRIWEWKAASGGTIIEQLKRLGASCDWSRLRFTMDEGLSKAVREVFVRLYEEGLIYRGKRLINWCPRCLTALSDIEVEHDAIVGKLYYIDYPLADGSGRRLTIATTRPETMLGDTAVAVHPDDPRYNGLIGKTVTLPLTRREIPIVGDPILVDREFGTGAVKITPAHDFNDFEAGVRHQLPQLSVLNQEAKMDPWGLQEAKIAIPLEQLAYKTAQQARSLIVDTLGQQGFLTKTEDHTMALGKCYRCKTVVEPYLSAQWFVKIKPLAEPAIKAVETGETRLIPDQWTNNYLAWMRDIKDWCISRQIWWGHQIPAWYCRHCNDEAFSKAKSGYVQVKGETTTRKEFFSLPITAKPVVARKKPSHCPDCGHSEPMIQDPDVLDTWFSSALWPFSTLGWPDKTPELNKYYPTSVLVTGFDILFFWVARMIMMGVKFMDQVPFRDVHIHALVRDAEGQKMSKSKGNVIDPLEVMEKYGTDALRFTLAAMASPGRDIKLAEERIQGYRNFANKLWNAARFVLMHLDGTQRVLETAASERSTADRWIISRLQRCIGEVRAALEAYRFDEAANTLYHFTWHEFCDWYLELAKPALADKDSGEAALTRATLVESFETLLRLLHPFMPFITEEIWQAIPHDGQSIMIAGYPTPDSKLLNESVEHEIGTLQRVISTVRDFRGSQGLPTSQDLRVTVTTDEITEQLLKVHADRIKALARVSAMDIRSGGKGLEVSISTEGLIDAAKQATRLEKRLKDVRAQIEQNEKKLANPEFMAKVSSEVLEKTRRKHQEFLVESEGLSNELRRLRQTAGGQV
jgi:valyl-tRNA synthetase